MTASAPIPAEAAPRMANPPTAPQAPDAEAPSQARTAASRPTLRSQVAENPLLSFFGLLIVALLAAAIAGPQIRINDTNDRIDRLEARMTAEFEKIDKRFEKIDARFEKIDARFDAIEARLDELDLKLTALIAALNATDGVNAAVEGRLNSPSG